ncbi:DUF4224 domain-containing protein [Paraburkholderia phenazinium]|uniref:Uncharacterized protein n=1 Tax=Paraburkholderia phenazinium TaxID=60549 RepID=A0A1G8FKW2_9BURK|nr:DUF4224 domain-containing protein [Paraburkholderia phenazinium]SDH82790.1 protein of unknown function [Paraburkholderia phenazinium]
MSFELLSNADLEAITGMKRYSAQAAWFKENFRVDPVRRLDGSIVLSKATFELMMARRMGVPQRPLEDLPEERPLLRSQLAKLRPVSPDRKPKKS